MTNTAINSVKNMTTKNRALTPEKVTAIEVFWRSVSEDSFVTADDINIAYAVNFKDPERPYIIIIPGRSEAYLKYQELAYDFDQLGYDCIIIDHRGQGLSQRLLKNRLKGYVEKFDDYAQDLHQLLSQVLPEKYPKQCYSSFMLAHSMGGPIALRYLQKYQHNVQALVLSSPMIAISSGKSPQWLANALVNIGVKINTWLTNEPWYFFGQSDNAKMSFTHNILMHSPERFASFQALYQDRPELKLGGVTFHWLKQSLIVNEAIFHDIEKITLPVLTIQAGKERLVDNQAQNNFCQQLQQINYDACVDGKPLIIEGAYHELFFEIDQYRNTAIEATLAWFNNNQSIETKDQ